MCWREHIVWPKSNRIHVYRVLFVHSYTLHITNSVQHIFSFTNSQHCCTSVNFDLCRALLSFLHIRHLVCGVKWGKGKGGVSVSSPQLLLAKALFTVQPVYWIQQREVLTVVVRGKQPDQKMQTAQEAQSWEKRAAQAFSPVFVWVLSAHNTEQEPAEGRDGRNNEGEGGSSERRDDQTSASKQSIKACDRTGGGRRREWVEFGSQIIEQGRDTFSYFLIQTLLTLL